MVEEIPLSSLNTNNGKQPGSGGGSGGEKHVHLHLPDDHSDTVTHNQRTHTNTMGYLTHDAVPLSVFYRNQDSMENIASADKRPTLDQLHKGEGLENAKKRHWVSDKHSVSYLSPAKCFKAYFKNQIHINLHAKKRFST